MVFQVTCKNEKDPIQNKGAGVVTTLFIDFSDAQGQVTPKLVKIFCRNSNMSKHSWFVLLPAKMMKIHLKMKALEWLQHFSHDKSMGIFPDNQGHLTPQPLVRSCQISNSSEILWLSLSPVICLKVWMQGWREPSSQVSLKLGKHVRFMHL